MKKLYLKKKKSPGVFVILIFVLILFIYFTGCDNDSSSGSTGTGTGTVTILGQSYALSELYFLYLTEDESGCHVIEVFLFSEEQLDDGGSGIGIFMVILFPTNSVTEGLFEFIDYKSIFGGEDFTYSAGDIAYPSDIYIFTDDETDDEFYDFIDGSVNISVSGSGSSAVYTITGDVTVTDNFWGYIYEDEAYNTHDASFSYTGPLVDWLDYMEGWEELNPPSD